MNNILIGDILEYLPHRYPFLLIDRILEYKAGESLVALKNVTINEPFFTGHFPEKPVMPGVLVVEALAQAAGILVWLTQGSVDKENLYYFAGIDKARFKRVILPGDQLHLHITIEKRKKDLWKFVCKATVDDKIACTANLMVAR